MQTIRRSVIASLLAVLLVAGAAAPWSSATPGADPDAAALGARWLAAQVQADGSVVGGFDPLGDAGSAALALAAAGVESEAFQRALGHVVSNIEAYIAPFGDDSAGRLGRALLLTDAAGLDPTDVGGVDLVARLQASLGAVEPDLYGAGAPDFDGVFRQGLAILGLVAVGETPAPAAVDWLVAQQCDAAVAAAAGGWESYRADLTVPCAAPDAASFSGPDSNATAMATMALASVGPDAAIDPLTYLAGVQEADGGWGYQAGGGSDPNSTGLVIQALVARGESLDAWGDPGTRPMDSLLSWVVPCGQPDEGAFSSAFSDGAGDVFASFDAIPGAAGATLPLGTVTLVEGSPEPCVDPEPTDPEPTDPEPTEPGDGQPIVPADTPPAAPSAVPVAATPTFTG
jgi:hypothetical protein